MYTVQIGKKFLELYNQKMGTALTPMEFFDQVYWQLFFNCEDEAHLFIVTNSKFFHPSIAKAHKDKPQEIPMARRIAFLDQIDNYVKGNEPITGGIAVGFMASSSEENTSGQVTDVKIQLSKDDILCSWIGGSLGIGIGGGVDLLTEDSDILWFIYQGWKYYRKLMKETPTLKGRQLQGWNGLWLMYGLAHKDNLENAYEYLTSRWESDKRYSEAGNIRKLERPDWYEQIIAWAKACKDEDRTYLVYGYNFGQMNRTYGFFYIKLPEIMRAYDLYDKLLIRSGESPDAENAFETVFKAQYSMERAIQTGGIGLRAITPKDLYKYLGGKPDLPKTDKNNLYTFLTYISWIQAMLNNDDTLALAEKLASTLKEFADYTDPNAKAGKTDRFRKVENLWEAKSRNQFINGLDELLQDKQPANPDVLNEIVQAVMLHIPSDQFTLFHTLVKFQFHYLKTKN